MLHYRVISSLRNYIPNGMISAGVLDRKIVLPNVCPGLFPSRAGALASLVIYSLHWFFSDSCCFFPSFGPTVFSLFFSSFLIFNALFKKLLPSTWQPQQPLLLLTLALSRLSPSPVLLLPRIPLIQYFPIHSLLQLWISLSLFHC